MSLDKLRDVFSFSKLTCFSQCPRRFWFQYVLRQKAPPAEYLVRGRATHAGQEHDNLERLKGNRPSKTEVLDAAANTYEEEGGSEVDRFVNEHDEQLRVYFEEGRDQLHPVPGSVEAVFEIELDVTADPDKPKEPAVLTGFVDVVSAESEDGGQTVVDYKTVKRPVSDKEAAASLQLALYQLGAEASGARIVNFVRYAKQKPTTKLTETTWLTERRKERLLTFVADTIASIRRNLESGDFPRCSPACYWCSETACDYFELCYGPNPNLSKWISIGEVRPVGTLKQPDWRKGK